MAYKQDPKLPKPIEKTSPKAEAAKAAQAAKVTAAKQVKAKTKARAEKPILTRGGEALTRAEAAKRVAKKKTQ